MKKSILILLTTSLLLAGCGANGISDADTAENAEDTANPSDPAQDADQNDQAGQDEESADDSKEGSEAETAESQYQTGLAPDWRENDLNVIDDKYRTYYEIFVYSFCDSDGDGIGDLQGIISKLDYLNDGDDATDTDLGINGIWLSPVMPSPSYHKYDVTDYENIDDQYGSLDDMKELLDECHKRGINVIIDLAMNHSSSEHPWFKQAYEYIQSLDENEEPDPDDCPYVDYYNFTKDQQGGYSEVTGTDWYYESQFVYSMPDLNLENDEVKAEFEDIASFWLDMGVDGFRLDAVKYYALGDDDENIDLLSWFNDYVKTKKEDAYIVCENWSDQTAYSRYYESGVDSMFDFAFADKDGIIANTVNGKNPASSFGRALQSEEELYAEYSEDYINAPFYTNHDMARSAGYYQGDDSEAKTKMGNALNLLTGGNVFLYYGEELGMKGSGKDENKRAPMYWSDDAAAEGMCAGPPDMETIKMKYGSLDDQEGDSSSIYSFVKDCIRLRNQIPAIARGNTVSIDELSDDQVCVISRTYEDQTVYVVYNISSEEKTVDLSSLSDDSLAVAGELYAADSNVSRDGNIIDMPAYSVIVLKSGDDGGQKAQAADEKETSAEYADGYESEEDFRTRDYGSVSLITDRTVLVSIFVNEPEDVWTEAEKKEALSICRIAYEGVKDILKEDYDEDTDLIYDWQENSDLVKTINIYEEIPAYVEADDEDHMDELEDEWVDQIDAESLLSKYQASSIGFLYLIPHEGCSYSSMHFVEDGPETWNEGCLLYLDDMYSPDLDRETPTVYAHELLHLFGAEDYYSSAEVFSKSTYNKLKSLCADDIMLRTYETVNGVYTTYPDEVHGDITPVTAYLLGIYDESAVKDLPELVRDQAACFPGSAKDRPF